MKIPPHSEYNNTGQSIVKTFALYLFLFTLKIIFLTLIGLFTAEFRLLVKLDRKFLTPNTFWFYKILIMKKHDLKFIGRNIRYLRRQRGWTISQLATKIEMNEVPLGRIERGENAPSAAVIYSLSKVLEIKIDGIFSETIERLQSYQKDDTKDPIYIKDDHFLEEIPASAKNMALDIIKAVHILEDLCNVRKHAKIPLLIPFTPTKDGIEQLSGTVRQLMDIGNGIVFDYFELLESMGFRTVVIPMQKKLYSFLYYDHINQNTFFFINARNNSERQIFQLLYQLGNILISNYSIQQGKDIFPIGKTLEYEINPFTSYSAKNLFAASFLMPRKNIQNTIEQLNIEEKTWSFELLLRIKHRYGVSAESFLTRMVELKYIDKTIAKLFLKKVKSFYEKTNNKEPDSSKRVLTPNGRIWDLILLAELLEKPSTEISKIKSIFDKWKLVKN